MSSYPETFPHFSRSRFSLILAAALSLSAFFSGCASADKQKAQAAAPRAVSVAVAKVEQQEMPVYLVGLGSVTAFYTANIKSRVDGQIMRVNFQEGQVVKEGDLLIVIDPRPYQVQLEQMQAQIFKDQATLRDARLNLERYTTLIPSGSIAQQQVDTQKSLVDQLDGQVRTDQAQIDNAKLQLVYCNITAPFTGRVGLRQVDPGNLIHPTDPTGIVTITQIHPISVVFTLPQNTLPRIMRAMAARKLPVTAVSSDDGTTVLDTGVLLTPDNAIDVNTGTIKLKATFPNKEGTLWPGQFVDARLLVETRSNVITVPSPAIQHGPDALYVYTVKPDQTIGRQNVAVAQDDGHVAVVTQGLDEGSIVVVSGQARVQQGTRVDARAEQDGGAPPAGPSAVPGG